MQAGRLITQRTEVEGGRSGRAPCADGCRIGLQPFSATASRAFVPVAESGPAATTASSYRPDSRSQADANLVQRHAADAHGSGPVGGEASALHGLGSYLSRGESGQSLPAPVQRSAERRLGPVVSSARVHRGPEARRITSDLQAHALTVGPHILMGERAGPRVLDHELVHVAQNRGRLPRPDQSLQLGRTDSRLEREADTLAHGPLFSERETLAAQPGLVLRATDLDMAHGGGIDQAEQDAYAAHLRDDIMAMLGVRTVYDPATGVIQIGDQNGDGVVDQSDYQAALARVGALEQEFQAADRCGNDQRCLREARDIAQELIESLLPADHPQARRLEVNLTHTMLVPGAGGGPNQLGYAYFRRRGPNDRNAVVAVDPQDYDYETEYRPRPGSARGQAFAANPNVDRVMGPMFLMLHEREHNVRGTRDAAPADMYNLPGSNERRVNSLRQGLGLPRRRAYGSRPARGGRSYTAFDNGWVYHPRYERP